MNKMAWQPKKMIKTSAKGAYSKVSGGKPSGKLDQGFYGHLEPEALKECDQIITSVTDITGDE